METALIWNTHTHKTSDLNQPRLDRAHHGTASTIKNQLALIGH